MILELTEWIASTSMSQTIQNVTWIIPVFQIVHILCVAIVMSSIGMIDMRLLGVSGKRQTISQMASRYLPWIWWALLILACTGTILLIGEPGRDLPNPAFQAKMFMLISVIIITLIFQRTVKNNMGFWDESPARQISAKLTAIVSLALWVSIVIAGRWIAYTGS